MRDVERLHRRDVGRNAILANLATDRNYLRDTGQGKKLRAQHEIR
jgi:hypothetical protein